MQSSLCSRLFNPAIVDLSRSVKAELEQLLQLESRHRPVANYLSDRNHPITEKMRRILVNWLHEVVMEFSLKMETFFLAVNLLDRFLSRVLVEVSKLQLVGISCLFLASKYEEINPPSAADCAIVTDNTYPREHIIRCEAIILNALDFQVTVTTQYQLLQTFLKLVPQSQNYNTVALLSHYLCEMTAPEYCMLKYSPSIIAISCISVALHTCNMAASLLVLLRDDLYREVDMCMDEVTRIYHEVSRGDDATIHGCANDAKTKYSEPQLGAVAFIPPPVSLPSVYSPHQPQPPHSPVQ